MKKFILLLFSLLFVFVPVVFFWKSSEVFELNKMVTVYMFTILLVTSWIIRMITEKRVIFKRTLLDIPLILFLLSQIISTIFSIDQHTSIFGYYSRFHGGLLSTISYLLLYWVYVSNVDRKGTLQIIKGAIFSAVFVSIWAILEHFYHSPSCLLINKQFDVSCWVQYERGPERVFATMGQPNWLAALLVSVSPFGWNQIVNSFSVNSAKKNNKKESQSNLNKYIWIGISALLFMALLFTKSRSGILAYFAVLFLFECFVYLKVENIFSTIFKHILALNLIIAILIILIGTPWTPNIGQIIKKIKPSDTPIIKTTTILDTGGTESGDIRKIVWEGAYKLWLKYPIFGSGVETFAYSYYETRPAKHNLTSEWDYLYNKAHNEYLNFLATTGTVGTTAYLTVIIFSLVQIVGTKSLKIDKIFFIDLERVALLLGFTSILITNFFGFSVVATGLLFFLIPAMVYSLDFSEKEMEVKTLEGQQTIAILFALLLAGYLLIVVGKYWQADYLFSQSKQTQRDFKLILEDAQKAVSISPNEPLYRDQLANLYASFAIALNEAHLTEKAEQYAQKADSESELALSYSPRNVMIQRTRANMLTDLGGIDSLYLTKAAQLQETIISYSPTDAKAFYKSGLSFFRIGQNEKAKELLQKAIELKPDYKDAIQSLNQI